MSIRRIACLVASVGALVSLAVIAPAASAAPPGLGGSGFANVSNINDVSGTSPFAYQSCNVVTSVWMHPGNQASETTIAVNPRDPQNEIGAYMDGSAGDLVTVYTLNGGKTWHKVVPQGLDQCTGDFSLPYEDTCDEWVSFGPDGTAYLSTMPFANFSSPTADLSQYISQVKVVVSHDGGQTWSAPVTVPPSNAVFDKDMILADPRVPGTVYESSTNNGYGFVNVPRGETEAVFNKSTNYGKTWTRTVIDSTGMATGFGNPTVSLGINEVAALKNGTLVFLSSRTIPGGSQIRVFRSTDRGDTWSGPINITTGSVRTEIVTVNDHTFAFLETVGTSQLVLWESTDSGLTWHSKTVITTPYPLLMPSIGTDREGRIGVTWFEQNTSTAPPFNPPNVAERQRFAYIDPDGKVSNPVTVGAAWWNLYSPTYASEWRQGDYIQVRATPDGFVTIAPQGPPIVAGPEAVNVEGNVDGVVVANIKIHGNDIH